MLVGRDFEGEHLRAVIDDVRTGKSRSLLIAGEAGIGKTALVAAAMERAADLTVLSARGIETEGEIGGAVLSELLGPPTRLRPELQEGWAAMPEAAAPRTRGGLEAATAAR